MSVERHNFYREVHKGLRVLLGSLVERAGQTDFQDAVEVAELRRAVAEGFAILEDHARHETRFITPLLRAHAPAVGGDVDGEHRAQARRMAELGEQLEEAAAAGPLATGKGHAFVVALSRFVGEILVHMADEEEQALPSLWAVLDDAALQRTHQQLVASLGPDEMARDLAWMLPAMNDAERFGMVARVRATAPPEAFQSLSALARRVLSPSDWERLERSLAAAA